MNDGMFFPLPLQVLILTLKTSAPHCLRFLVCAVCLYTGFLFCGWIMFSPYNLKVCWPLFKVIYFYKLVILHIPLSLIVAMRSWGTQNFYYGSCSCWGWQMIKVEAVRSRSTAVSCVVSTVCIVYCKEKEFLNM